MSDKGARMNRENRWYCETIGGNKTAPDGAQTPYARGLTTEKESL